MKTQRSTRPVIVWLYIGVAMVIVQVILGGITRLTGSGLSIPEWNLVMGTLPPLNEAQWLAAFEKYKGTEQFRQLNPGFTLHDFKFIFFWEWFHRQWGKLISVVFLIPFIVFLVQRRFSKDTVVPFIILFLLGALQGAVGWIMVVSGLTGDAVYVRPVELGMHLLMALILLSYTYWFALKFVVQRGRLAVNKSLQRFTWIILLLLFVQLFYGALMAGYKAAPYAPTWPTINGQWAPAGMSQALPENLSAADRRSWQERQAIITTHFIHRGLAYTLVLLVLAWTVAVYKARGTQVMGKTRWLPASIVALQTTLGVLTVLSSTIISAYKWGRFEWLAQLHQLTAVFLLLSLLRALFLLHPNQKLHSGN